MSIKTIYIYGISTTKIEANKNEQAKYQKKKLLYIIELANW